MNRTSLARSAYAGAGFLLIALLGCGTDAGVEPPSDNPVPSVTAASPGEITVGVAGLALTVDGAGFIVSSVVRWNGSNRTTTFVSSTQLTVAITAEIGPSTTISGAFGA